MGSDGALGLKALRAKGHYTIAQDAGQQRGLRNAEGGCCDASRRRYSAAQEHRPRIDCSSCRLGQQRSYRMTMNETGTAPPPSEGAIVVLLVDDQAMVSEAIRRALLNEPDVQFRYCANPMEAVAVAKEVKPTVILQDLVMPNVSGLELVRQYRAEPATGNIPIIVLSTKEEPAIKSEAFKMGANDYLGQIAGPDRADRPYPPPLDGLPRSASARRGLSRASREQATAHGYEPRA